ncbi:MAG: elongation factor G [Lachnospiraceae bacterium]
MNVYQTKDIRNVVLLGHGGAGKTTLVEAAAWVAGITKRQGSVIDGSTISDYDKEEQKRQFSINTAIVPVEVEGIKINFIDTPGYFDFVGEVEEAVSVADAAIIVINGKAGIEPGTEKAWELCEKHHLPRMIFVTNMDDDHASFRNTVMKLNEKYGRKIAPFYVPWRENEKFVGFVNVVKMQGRRFTEKSEFVDCEIPAYLEKHVNLSRESLMEAVAETSEEFMERYFDGDEFTYEEISEALQTNVRSNQIVPVLMGSGINAQGLKMLMYCIRKYLPSCKERAEYGKELDTNELEMIEYDAEKHISAKVFKTIIDPFIGKYSLIKVVTGVMKPGCAIYNVNKGLEDRAAKIYLLRGKEAIEVPELHAGDIGALAKMDSLSTGDTIAVKGSTVVYDAPEMSIPYTYKKYNAKNKADEDKVAAGLAKLMDEDLTLKIVNDAENRQTLIYGIGDQQLEVVASKLANRYKVEIVLDKPKFAFRETIKKKAKVQGKHKKQSGGHGQYGDVIMEFEPSGDLETPYIFEEKVVGGAVPKNYFPAVEKGLQESVLKGPLAGYPVVGLKATLLDGSYHPVDSSEMAFKMATILAFKKGFMEAQPILLEPIVSLKVTVPNANAGDIMGDLNRRRGRVLGMDHIQGGKQVITADIPISEIYGYSTDLRSMTGGMGSFEYEFSRYEQTPGDIQAKEVAARAEV